MARIQHQNMHHSQSAPVLSSLLQKAEGSPTLGSAGDQCSAMKKELLEKIEDLGKILPPNTLDELINSLGGPDNVAEVSILSFYSIPPISFIHFFCFLD